MSLSPEIIDAMLESGCTAEQIGAVVKAALVKHEKCEQEEIDRKREAARLRKQKQRDRESANVTPCHTMSHHVTVTKKQKEKRTKKEKIKNNKNIYTKKSAEGLEQHKAPNHELDEQFETFWQAYPRQRRGSTDNALPQFTKALARDSFKNIMTGVKAYAGSEEVAKGYAKGAAAWLRDDRWLNEYQTSESAPTEKIEIQTDDWPDWKKDFAKHIGEPMVSSWFGDAKYDDGVLLVGSNFKAQYIRNEFASKLGIDQIEVAGV